MAYLCFREGNRHRFMAGALAAALIFSPPGGSVALASEGSDVATYRAMAQASVDSLQARTKNVIQATFDNVKKGAPSRMACVDKWNMLSLNQLLTGSFASAVGKILNELMTKLMEMAMSYACQLLDSYWSQAVSAIEGVGAGVTLPGGAGTVNVSMAVGGKGITLQPSGNIYGANVGQQLSTPSQGTEPNSSLFEQGKNWVGSGIDRVKSWYK